MKMMISKGALILPALMLLGGGFATAQTEPPYESRFMDAGGVSLHYLDFGGEGLPVVFVHSESWDAHTYDDFAPRFTDTSRVLAVTRPGYGESEAHPEGFDVAAQAESLIDFLDALGIERAVFAGNSSPAVHLTYLAEHHPERVAGVIYLAGLLTPWLREVRESDPAGAGVMTTRASVPDATGRERHEALMSYRPEFLAGDQPPIEVPALAFSGRSGTIGHERFSKPLAVVGSALMADFFAELEPSSFRDYFQRLIDDPNFRSESLRAVEDSAAREFLLRLAEDTELQAEVWRYQLETAGPAVLAGQDRFRRAFDRLRLVRLDVSTVYGYEYRDAPELIEPHIRRFLEKVQELETARPSLGDGWPTAAPFAVGLDPERLAAMTTALRAGELGNVHAVLVERDGRLVYEAYFEGEDETWGEDLGVVTFGRASLHDLRSVSKSLVSTLVGIAIGRGEIPSVETALAELLPDYTHLLTGQKGEIRLRHVLSMSAGLRWDEWSLPYDHPENDWQRLTEAADPVAFVLGRALVYEPGTTFTYNGGLTHLLAVILERAAGESLQGYARRVLFEPLGIHDVVWRGEIGGLPSADAGLRMRPRDLAKLGSVFLNGGRWKGEDVVPEGWTREVAVARVEPPFAEPAPDFVEAVGYGYQWWVGRYRSGDRTLEVLMAHGNGQQRVMVVPEFGLVATVLAGFYDTIDPAQIWAPDRLLVEHIIAATSR